jgi:ATP-dependent Lon protease
MRKRSFTDAHQKYFRLGRDLNQRDTIAVNRMVSGFVKLVYPNGEFDKEDIREILTLALESRRRVKEQLKKIGGMEFYDVNFSYIDLEDDRDYSVGVEEQVSSTLIPEGELKPGHLYSVGPSESGKPGVYKFETEMMNGNGKFTPSGIGSKKPITEAVKIAYQYFKSNASSISGQISYKDKDYVMQVKDLHGIGMTNHLTLATFIALCSVATNRHVLPSLAILGNFSIGGTVEKVQNLADALQVCLDSGAKKVLIPMSSYADIGLVPPELFSKFTTIPYNTPEEAVMKAFGVE